MIKAYGASPLTRAADLMVSMRRDLDELQRQLVTRKKAETYGGLGVQRGVSLDARGKLAAINGYRAGIEQAELRVKLVTQGVEQLAKDRGTMNSDLFAPEFNPDASGRTSVQKAAEGRLTAAINILNSDVNGRYVFGGRKVDGPPVESFDRIMNGDAIAGLTGLRDLIAQRRSADLGADGLGRLAYTDPAAGATTFRIDEAADAGVRQNFGFVLGGASSASGGIAMTLTAGTAPTTTLAFAAAPAEGDVVRVYVNDAAGRQRPVDLTARAGAADPAKGEFQIGTAAEMNTRIGAALPAGSTIAGVQSRFVGAPTNQPLVTATIAGGAAASLAIDVTAQPQNGQTVKLTLGLRDGRQETITLTARTTLTGEPNEFRIGGTLAETASALSTAMKAAVKHEAASSLSAASATLTTQDFFSAAPTTPRWPRQLAAPPADPATATGFAPIGATARAVVWYKGEESTSPRDTAPLRVDANQTVATGAQADERSVSVLLEHYALLAAEPFSTKPEDRKVEAERFADLADATRKGLAVPEALKIENMAVDFQAASATMKEAMDRHKAAEGMMLDAIDGVEEVTPEEAGAAILSLQARLQASYQTTAILSRLSLVNYL